MGANQLLDIERRIELAGLELLKAWTLLTALTTAPRVRRAWDKSVKADYPAGTIEAVMMSEYGRMTGWYNGAMRLSALTFQADDKDRVVCDKIMGSLRGWAQQEDLKTQMNASASAIAAGTELAVEYIVCDGIPFWADETDRVNELVLDVRILARPSRGTGK